jgi:hypothetical protein
VTGLGEDIGLGEVDVTGLGEDIGLGEVEFKGVVVLDAFDTGIVVFDIRVCK